MRRGRALPLAVLVAGGAVLTAAAARTAALPPRAVAVRPAAAAAAAADGGRGAAPPAARQPGTTRMHAAMRDAALAQPARGADATFAASMIAHHEGAVEMARAELRHGRDEQLRRLAQDIIVTQGQEILVMRRRLADAGRSADRTIPTKGR